MTSQQVQDTYEYRSATISRIYHHQIDREQFERLKHAQEFLLVYMSFEEAMAQLSYSEQAFEEFIITSALDNYLHPIKEYDNLQDIRLKCNLLILGFLSSMTSLRDQFPKFKHVTRGASPRDAFVRDWNSLKSKSVAFSFCEHLRNYAQHQGQPVYSVTSGGGWTELDLLESHLSVFGRVADVCGHRGVSRKDAAAYEQAFGEQVDLALIIRESFGLIGGLALRAREALAADFEQAMSVYREALETVSTYVESLLVSKATHLVADEVVEEYSIFEEFADRAERLRRRHIVTNSQAHFISNRARGHSAKPIVNRKRGSGAAKR